MIPIPRNGIMLQGAGGRMNPGCRPWPPSTISREADRIREANSFSNCVSHGTASAPPAPTKEEVTPLALRARAILSDLATRARKDRLLRERLHEYGSLRLPDELLEALKPERGSCPMAREILGRVSPFALFYAVNQRRNKRVTGKSGLRQELCRALRGNEQGGFGEHFNSALRSNSVKDLLKHYRNDEAFSRRLQRQVHILNLDRQNHEPVGYPPVSGYVPNSLPSYNPEVVGLQPKNAPMPWYNPEVVNPDLMGGRDPAYNPELVVPLVRPRGDTVGVEEGITVKRPGRFARLLASLFGRL